MPAASILGAQSALAPAGRAAERLFDLSSLLFISGAIIWLAFYTLYARQESRTLARANLLIVAGGAMIPTTVLGMLLAYGLALLDFATLIWPLSMA